MKIGASTLSGFKDDIGTNLEYFEELGWIMQKYCINIQIRI